MDSTYIFLQHYWWFLVSLLGALLVFLLFVQGGNSLLYCLGRTEEERTLLVNSTGRKWEFTFTTLVTFGGAFFASFPLFYSTSFGGAYWLWMIILFSFVLQALSYEFQSKLGNWLGKRTYQFFLVLNGIVGPLLLGAAVATFFNGSNFVVSKGNLTDEMMPVISHWGNGWHGLDAFADPWNLILGFALLFLARLLGNLYFINNIRHEALNARFRRQLIADAVPFLVFFLAFVIRTLLKDGFAVNPETGQIVMEPFKYFHNFIAMPYLFDNVILAPCHNDFIFYDLLRWIGQRLDLQDEFFTQEFHVKLVNINLAAPFFVHMSTAFWMSVVTAAPYFFYEIWRFVSPALYPNERKGVRKALGIGTVMFFIGVLLGYFMVYPLTLRFLSTYQLSAAIENQISLNSYIDNFMMLVLCMGLAFELPLVTWLLSLLGLVHKTFLRKYRRHAVVIIVIASAIITPTGDPFTLTVVAVPLYLLYELSILMIKDKKTDDEAEEVETEE